MFCEKCGKQIDDNAMFCQFCGEKTTEEEPAPASSNNENTTKQFCEKCGKQIDSNSIFCQFCGAKTTEEETTPVSSNNNVNTTNQDTNVIQPKVNVTVKAPKQRSNSLITFILIIALCFGGWYVYNNHINTPEKQITKTMEKFEESYNDLNLPEMVKCFEPKMQLAYNGVKSVANGLLGGSGDVLEGMVQIIPAYMEISGEEMGGQPQIDVNIKSISVNENKATAEVLIIQTYTGSTTKNEVEDTFKFQKFDEGWLILMN